MIFFSLFFKNTWVYEKKKQMWFQSKKKTSFVEENIIYLSTKIEFDGEKVPKTYENEFWNQHIAENWMVVAFFSISQTIIQESMQKSKTPGLHFTPIQQLHDFNTTNV